MLRQQNKEPMADQQDRLAPPVKPGALQPLAAAGNVIDFLIVLEELLTSPEHDYRSLTALVQLELNSTVRWKPHHMGSGV